MGNWLHRRPDIPDSLQTTTNHIWSFTAIIVGATLLTTTTFHNTQPCLNHSDHHCDCHRRKVFSSHHRKEPTTPPVTEQHTIVATDSSCTVNKPTSHLQWPVCKLQPNKPHHQPPHVPEHLLAHAQNDNTFARCKTKRHFNVACSINPSMKLKGTHSHLVYNERTDSNSGHGLRENSSPSSMFVSRVTKKAPAADSSALHENATKVDLAVFDRQSTCVDAYRSRSHSEQSPHVRQLPCRLCGL